MYRLIYGKYYNFYHHKRHYFYHSQYNVCSDTKSNVLNFVRHVPELRIYPSPSSWLMLVVNRHLIFNDEHELRVFMLYSGQSLSFLKMFCWVTILFRHLDWSWIYLQKTRKHELLLLFTLIISSVHMTSTFDGTLY